MSKKVIIIGAGMAGLSAATYLRMNGYDTHLFEMNEVPGGVCTSWQRGDYTVDLCVHWLVGSGPASSFYERWNELMELDKIDFVNHEEYARVEDEAGRQLTIYTDIEKLEAELLAKAPEDTERIHEFCDAIRKLTELDLPTDKANEVSNLWDKMKAFYKMLPFMGVFGKYTRLSNADYAQTFQNPLLHKAIHHLFEPQMSVIFSMMTLAWMHNKTAGYPIGGSMRFAAKIAAHYHHLGGRIYYNRKVTRILTKNDTAIGIETQEGERYYADYVISAADGYDTLFNMLEEKYLTPRWKKQFEQHPTFPSLVFVALGVDRTFEELPHSYLFPIHEALEIDPQTTVNDLMLRVHKFDPTLAPSGKTVLSFMLETSNYEYWTDLHKNDKATYESEKVRIATQIIEQLEQKFGNFKDKVEMVDIATPATFVQYTNNWHGSFEGWLLTPETGFRNMQHTLPKLRNFYMCGHWVAVGGGLPTVMLSGREVAQMICQEDHKPFEVVTPRTLHRTDTASMI